MKIFCLFFISILFLGCQDKSTNFSHNINHIENNTNILSWREKYRDIILDSMPDKNIYQIKVLNQQGEECSYHIKRNLIFFASILHDQKSAANNYTKMIDQGLYIKFKNAFDNLDLDNIIIKTTTDNYSDILPSNFNEIKTSIAPIIYFKKTYLTKSYQDSLKPNKELLEYIKDQGYVLTIDENNVTEVDINSQKDQFYQTLLSFKNGIRSIIAFDIILSSTSSNTRYHATSLLAQKDGEKTIYYFMDPLNWKISSHESYQKTIFTLIKFIEDPDQFLTAWMMDKFANIYLSNDIEGLITYILGFDQDLKQYYDHKSYRQIFKPLICGIIDEKAPTTPLSYTDLLEQKQHSNNIQATLKEIMKCEDT